MIVLFKFSMSYFDIEFLLPHPRKEFYLTSQVTLTTITKSFYLTQAGHKMEKWYTWALWPKMVLLWHVWCIWFGTEIHVFYHCRLCAHSVGVSVFLNLKSENRSYLPACSTATLKSATPTKVIVGAMVSGPMKRRRKPRTPVSPITIWNSDEIIMAPWI